MARSPIEIMVDKACGIPDGPPKPFDAEIVAATVLHHIDKFYPAMWNGVPKNARRSLRGTIINEINAEMKRSDRSEGK